jgi:hypothetical protein
VYRPISLILPDAPPVLGAGVFFGTGTNSKPLVIRMGSGVDAYETAWGSADPGKKTEKYGIHHKAISIVVD